MTYLRHPKALAQAVTGPGTEGNVRPCQRLPARLLGVSPALCRGCPLPILGLPGLLRLLRLPAGACEAMKEP